jgi:hypothetical protein
MPVCVDTAIAVRGIFSRIYICMSVHVPESMPLLVLVCAYVCASGMLSVCMPGVTQGPTHPECIYAVQVSHHPVCVNNCHCCVQVRHVTQQHSSRRTVTAASSSADSTSRRCCCRCCCRAAWPPCVAAAAAVEDVCYGHINIKQLCYLQHNIAPTHSTARHLGTLAPWIGGHFATIAAQYTYEHGLGCLGAWTYTWVLHVQAAKTSARAQTTAVSACLYH